jgi:hypothetical protein
VLSARFKSARASAEGFRPQQFEVLATRLRNTVPAPLADRGRLDPAKASHDASAAQGVDDGRIGMAALFFHGPMIGTPNYGMQGLPIGNRVRLP